ncbi:hypothetical protein [Streptomyces albipurpureus]|uniref:Uncharacterized protein n=1 Tax=Streptomyces albipurpureus TaxID=2897419 RepID=A0ABT0UFU6_9ACTN|nr:hypothetical protein [Streptomyces sp. CWNU-1]MCM2387493.1 hypothetical protein [Streptomyces sp. CWNU-1]
MHHNRFTGADRVRRNFTWAAMVSVPTVIFLLFLVFVQNLTGAWIGLVMVALLWLLVLWRFTGVGTRGLPPQR